MLSFNLLFGATLTRPALVHEQFEQRELRPSMVFTSTHKETPQYSLHSGLLGVFAGSGFSASQHHTCLRLSEPCRRLGQISRLRSRSMPLHARTCIGPS